ncbi:histone-like nucleoid-structuring protein Lsr2 [Pseudactinotalea sp. Z1748]|uniref:histone-like nucleoid-structuring protein Lsr2 n=1 Tax=Pseudactinotalea sp. Z1748 TaxID=3413027 RepID=UPI003C7C6692
MSRKTVVEFIDDLDGSHAHATVRFGLEDQVYEIDLSEKNLAALRSFLGPYIASARKVRDGVAEPDLVRIETKVDPQAVRKWARSRGIEIPSRARIPQEIIDQFRAAGY